MLGCISSKDTNHEYLVYYHKAYGNVPLWVAVNAMTFGQMSKMLVFLEVLGDEVPRVLIVRIRIRSLINARCRISGCLIVVHIECENL